MLELNRFYNMDCMEGMKQFPDKYFELAIVDPPYGDVKAGGYMNGKSAGGVAKHPKYNYSIWSQKKPSAEYFTELFRISQNQIIWGGNYFAAEICRDSTCWIVWDKVNGATKWADCELAWTSFDRAARLFHYMWNGMLQGKSVTEGQTMQGKKELNEIRIHPTQKPVALYKWILQNFAKTGDKIIDTHVGSASSLVACYEMGFDCTGFEIDRDYYIQGSERLESLKAQQSLFRKI